MTVLPNSLDPHTASAETPTIDPAQRIRLLPAGPALYRVADSAGRILGHLSVIDHPLGARFAALRYQPALARFRSLGDFWTADEAVGVLRGS
jgi:hypothetical protein